MRRFTAYVVASFLVVLTLFLIVPQLGIGISVRALPVVAPGSMIQSVDRTGKGDRLPISVTTVDKEPAPDRPQKIKVGCDPAFSPLAGSRANFPGRCAV
jgi:hypothetical protein